jgi:hypothetical protein
MPPNVIMSVGVAGGMPRPAPLPNIPTDEMPTVPQYFFCTCGYALMIQEKTQKSGLKRMVGGTEML